MGIVYDAAGREASRTGDFGAVGFTYSDAGRLTGVDASGTTGDSASAYSAAGNLETQTVDTSTTVMSYEADSQRLVNRRVDGSVVATYTFDGLGQRTAQGPTANKTAEVFGYTGTGRLASYATSSGTSAAYSFDANGQRTRSVVRSDDVTTTTTDWTYEGLQLLSLSASRSDDATWAITYLYDSGGKPYAGVYRASDEETSTPFLLITNHRGDVLALTDTAGQRFATWTYDEWGVITTSTTEATGSITASLAADIASRQPLRYAGYCYDTETKMYYCSARTYDPLTRQFLSKDPAKADGEESAYQYCSGNPVEKVDPSGLKHGFAMAQERYFPSKDSWTKFGPLTYRIVAKWFTSSTSGSACQDCHEDSRHEYAPTYGSYGCVCKVAVKVKNKKSGKRLARVRVWKTVMKDGTTYVGRMGGDKWISLKKDQSYTFNFKATYLTARWVEAVSVKLDRYNSKGTYKDSDSASLEYW